MPRKAQDLAAKAERFASAWNEYFPEKTFSGFTLEEFRETFKPCREVRVRLAELASERKHLIFRRRKHDTEMRPIFLRVVHAVRGDPEVGEDSPMYGAMGYILRHRRRKPGRKRKARVSGRAAEPKAAASRSPAKPSRTSSR